MKNGVSHDHDTKNYKGKALPFAIKHAKTAQAKILAEGNAIREISTIIPTPPLLGRSIREPDPTACVNEGIKGFLRVAKYGLCDDINIAGALDLLESCVMLLAPSRGGARLQVSVLVLYFLE